MNKFLIIILLILNYTCYSQADDFTELNEKTVEEFLTNQDGFVFMEPFTSKDFKIYSSIKEFEFGFLKKEIWFKNGYPLSYYLYNNQRYDKKHVVVKKLNFSLVESILEDEIKFIKENNLQFEKLTQTEYKTKRITQNEIYQTEEGTIGENEDHYLVNLKREQILTLDKFPMLRWGSTEDDLQIIKISTYNIESMIKLFIKDLKNQINNFKNNSLDIADTIKLSELINNLDKNIINATFEEIDNETLAISYGINNDKNILIKVNPITWNKASNQKKWYIIYHELGHDVLNFQHGEGDKMMFNFIDKKYTWNEFFEDRKKMFDIYFSKIISKNKTNIKREIIPIKTVKIGTQTWTSNNLNVSRYKNGDIIPEVKDQKEWDTLTTGAWCYYNNDPKYGAIYGKLYNWYAVNDPRGLAPEGFHIPSQYEWTKLINFLGGEDIAGGKMKEIGTMHWLKPNKYATNSSGFNGLPGGQRYSIASFFDITTHGNWWSSAENDSYTAKKIFIWNSDNGIGKAYYSKEDGFSVRCIKD